MSFCRELGNARDKEAIKKEEKNKAGLQMFIGSLCQIEFQWVIFLDTRDYPLFC